MKHFTLDSNLFLHLSLTGRANVCLRKALSSPFSPSLKFKGANKYLEALVAWIDAPQLSTLYITFSSRIVFGSPILVQFIHRAPSLKAFGKARVFVDDAFTWVNLSSQTPSCGELNVRITYTVLDRLLSFLEQVLISFLPPLSTLEDLYIYEVPHLPLDLQGNNIENAPWALLHPFASVKNLYLSKEFVPRIAHTLKELVRAGPTEVLPILENIFWERLEPSGTVQEGIEQFVAAQQDTGHAIATTCWD